MLKLLSHFWLILSLLVAPVQFASADMAAVDHGQMKCDMMNMADHDMATMNHDMSTEGGCECPEQCKVNCASAHMSLAMTTALQVLSTNSSTKLISRTSSIAGIDQVTELRPPKKLYA